MAQKTNPISLRLKINRRFDSFWYSSFFYSDLFGRDLKVRKHFQKLFRQSKKRSFIGHVLLKRKEKINFLFGDVEEICKKHKFSLLLILSLHKETPSFSPLLLIS